MAIDDIDSSRPDDAIDATAELPVGTERGPRLAVPSLGMVRAILTLTATALSIGAAAYGFSPLTMTPARGAGEIRIVVERATDRRAVAGASIEILTRDDAVVTMVASNDAGRARQSLKEGRYRVRIHHPGYVTTTRVIQVTTGQTTDVRISLQPPAPTAAPPAGTEAPPAIRTEPAALPDAPPSPPQSA